MKRLIQSYLLKIDGASAVEFALIAPILLMLLIGTVDYGMFITEQMKLQATVSAAADYAAQSQSDDNVNVIAEEIYGPGFNDITVTSEFICECSDGVASACPVSCGGGDYQRRFISVNAAGDFSPLIPYPGLPASLSMSSTAKMRVD